MPLILNGLPPLHWAVAGAGIAAVTLCLLVLANRRLGISTGFEDVCSLVLHQTVRRISPPAKENRGGYTPRARVFLADFCGERSNATAGFGVSSTTRRNTSGLA